ncbi:DMT family transporter [Roseibium suaedae]|uniref:Permease of the drug/metabolite transporter (DMT) superfamily n=1 Tax=Roseibium suaedae TaxID=735517 RepID=A0A1M7N972_9HYPH|nr:DMT family transporter [Roseibium suaedae]SHN00168.1 Permease of the drug/metabolite transporter (DMT) superfamily [Roseibium suaedae]
MNSFLKGAIPGTFVLLWSTGFIGAKMGAPYADPMVFLSWRFALVLPLLLAVSLFTRPKWPTNPVQIAHCVVTGFLIHGCYLGAVFWAVDHGMPAGATAIVVGLQPVFSTLAAALLLGEKVEIKHWAGLVIGGAGLGLVLGPKLGLAGSGIDPVNIAVVFLGVLTISVGTVYQKRFVPQTDHLAGTFWQYIGALLVTVPLSLTESWTVVWSGEFIFALAWLVLVLSIGAIMLLMILIRQGAISQVASLFYLVPVATSIESYLLFGERLSLVQIGGMLLVICAVLLIRRPTRRIQPA